MTEHKFVPLKRGEPIPKEAEQGFEGLMAVGEDDFGLFACALSVCPHCNQSDQLVVFWNVHPKPTPAQVFHLPSGINPEKTPSLILSKNDPPRIGFTCGCYGKLHRQVAHIKKAMQQRDNARTRASKKRRK